jgi:TRAP-type mannitol/chloroaromatic compound transport system permease large subunit
VTFATIFRGVLPFIVTDLIRLVILIAFPIIALWLPSRM